MIRKTRRGNRALVSEWAGRDIAPLDHKLGCMAEMHEWVQAQFGTLFAGAQGRLRAFEATLVQAKLDGVARLETGETPWAITLHNGSATALTEALRVVHARVAPDIEWIPQLDLAREVPVDVHARRLAPFLELGFWRSLDMSGDELAQPTAAFKPLYRKAKDADLRLKAHVLPGVYEAEKYEFAIVLRQNAPQPPKMRKRNRDRAEAPRLAGRPKPKRAGVVARCVRSRFSDN